jgi:DNA-binding winged helix-turn-helix (wHTH) protein
MTMHIRPTPSPRHRNPLAQGASRLRRETTASEDLEFGRFRVLRRRRQLLADGVPVELGTRAFDLLLALLEADGSLVTKDELMSRVWPGITVSEENIKLQVSVLRKALGTDRDLILTECGRGYRFTGVLLASIVLEPCRPMRSKRRSAPSLTLPRNPWFKPGEGRKWWKLPSCRHSLQCSVNAISCTDRSAFADLDPMRR